ncbi:MAG: nickel-responsive transcriptional regulator NikR [Gammaproteobacteria bacterium]
MERLTISLDEELARQFDVFIRKRGYQNRSEAIRDLIRQQLAAESIDAEGAGHCVGSLTYIYNHEERELSSRLTRAQHRHHDIALSTMHVHLNHDDCMETVILRGPVAEVRAFANSVVSRPGVRHGNLHLVPVDIETGDHSHAGGHGHRHLHSRPKA